MNWEDALHTVCAEFKGQAQQWGTFDCCQFVARYVELMTGRNHAVDFNYQTEIGAAKVLLEAGGIKGLLSRFLQEKDEPEPGDLVVCYFAEWEQGRQAPGVFNGVYVVAFTDKGLSRLDERSIEAAWSL